MNHAERLKKIESYGQAYDKLIRRSVALSTRDVAVSSHA